MSLGWGYLFSRPMAAGERFFLFYFPFLIFLLLNTKDGILKNVVLYTTDFHCMDKKYIFCIPQKKELIFFIFGWTVTLKLWCNWNINRSVLPYCDKHLWNYLLEKKMGRSGIWFSPPAIDWMERDDTCLKFTRSKRVVNVNMKWNVHGRIHNIIYRK